MHKEVTLCVCVCVCSVLVSHNIMDAAPMLDDLGTDNLSPQLEVGACL